MSLDWLFGPVEEVDHFLTQLLDGAPLLVALGIAFLLGLRHASDPDHLVAVTSLVAADGGDTRGAAKLGAWWGVGHAGVLLLLGLPLIALKGQLPAGLESGAERAVGVIIVLLAVRVLAKWARGDFRRDAHAHAVHTGTGTVAAPTGRHRHLWRGSHSGHGHGHGTVRSPAQAVMIGTVHGLAGTGAVVLLLLAALPTKLEAAAALAVFAPMSVVSMALCTSAFAWLLTRPAVEPLYRTALIPALGVFGVLFGGWYAGIT
jgi:ABC-type nickel/cobalt efflux system permease component RcnA